MGYWRNHIPGFSVIAGPLYTLMSKNQNWQCLDSHKQALQTLRDELKTLEPVHPSDPVTWSFADWGFAEHGTYCNVSERPHGSKRPLEFSFTALKDTEKRYTAWENALLSLTCALK